MFLDGELWREQQQLQFAGNTVIEQYFRATRTGEITNVNIQ
jgi:hypothetical protein